jgi:hypothetical protein
MRARRRLLVSLVAVLAVLLGPERKSSHSAALAPVPAPAKDDEPRDPEPKRGDYVYAAGYSRDGTLLALAQPKTHDGKGDHKILLLETRTWKQLHKLTGPTTHCFAVAFSADGNTLFAACSDGIVYSWDTKTGNPRQKLDAKAGQCHAVVLSPDGKTLATGHLDTDKMPPESSIHLWDAATVKSLRTLASEIPVLANTLAFTPDSKTIAGGYNNQLTGPTDFSGVIEWDLASGKERKRYDAVRITPGAYPITHAISYTRDGKWLLVGGGEAVPAPGVRPSTNLFGYLWLFDRTTGKVEKTLIAGRHDYVRKLCLSPDEDHLYLPTNTPPRKVVENGRLVERTFGELQCWDTRTWELKWTRESASAGFYWALIASPDGQRIGTATLEGLYLFDAKTGKPQGGLIDSKPE